MSFDCCAARQASGSGGTAGGIALGLHLAGHADVRVHAFGVCDDPDYFYDYIDGLYADMGATPAAVGESCNPLVPGGFVARSRPTPAAHAAEQSGLRNRHAAGPVLWSLRLPENDQVATNNCITCDDSSGALCRGWGLMTCSWMKCRCGCAGAVPCRAGQGRGLRHLHGGGAAVHGGCVAGNRCAIIYPSPQLLAVRCHTVTHPRQSESFQSCS